MRLPGSGVALLITVVFLFFKPYAQVSANFLMNQWTFTVMAVLDDMTETWRAGRVACLLVLTSSKPERERGRMQPYGVLGHGLGYGFGLEQGNNNCAMGKC